MTMELLKDIIKKIEAVGGKIRNVSFDLGNKSIIKAIIAMKLQRF